MTVPVEIDATRIVRIVRACECHSVSFSSSHCGFAGLDRLAQPSPCKKTISWAGLGESVEPSEPAVTGGEGDTVTLTCSYNTDYSGGIYLYWYRHYPNRAPRYILWRGAKSFSKLSDTAEFAEKRFSSQTDDSSTVLTIKPLELADTAVYLCALQRAQ
ncbi:T-cell receptor alpha chain V region RL-5 [Platysternon megacephalum]|nr:T-cell receptor alpha chain V region RL-5 [Platysternon megacephalum]